MARHPDGLIAIYGLHDPRSGDLRYIGQANDPQRRWREHRSPKRAAGQMRAWVAELSATGLRPDLRVREWVTDSREGELRHVKAALAGGIPLLNVSTGMLKHRDRVLSPEAKARMAANGRAALARMTPEERARRAEMRRVWWASLSAEERAFRMARLTSAAAAVNSDSRLSADAYKRRGAKNAISQRGRVFTADTRTRMAAAHFGKPRNPIKALPGQLALGL